MKNATGRFRFTDDDQWVSTAVDGRSKDAFARASSSLPTPRPPESRDILRPSSTLLRSRAGFSPFTVQYVFPFFRAEALVQFDYEAREPDELTLKKGDIVTDVKPMPDGWMEGFKDGKKGMFPDNYVRVPIPSPRPSYTAITS